MLNSLANRTLIVTTILSAPYCMHKEFGENLTGNDQYEGYGVDVVAEVSRYLGFNYTFQLVPDGKHGNLNPKTKQWNGMILELMNKRADLAIADLSITYDRLQVVDFSVPFMDLGISLLYWKPSKQPPNMFSFVSPLSPLAWIAVVGVYILISALLFILSRHTPRELTDVNHEPHTVLENQSSLFNCFWFSLGPLTQQGCELLPSAISTRMAAGMWWFFALIIISCYTANLAAFLTVEKLDSPIKSVEDLAYQTKVKYGVYSGGSSTTFFREATRTSYQRMWNVMESSRPTVFTSSNSEGAKRVLKEKGGYAFLMESVSIQYVTERQCELAQIGGQLDRKGYGIAVPKNATYLAAVNEAVLKLHELGVLDILKIRWWKSKRGGGRCKNSGGSQSATKLGLANVGGIFLVFTCGVFLSGVFFFAEITISARHRKMKIRVLQPSPASYRRNKKTRRRKKKKQLIFYYTE